MVITIMVIKSIEYLSPSRKIIPSYSGLSINNFKELRIGDLIPSIRYATEKRIEETNIE